MTEENNGPKSFKYKYLLMFFPLAVVIWIGYLYLISYYLFPNDLCSSGLFGDMFGGINALFSGLAFVGIILTIYLQKRELSLQREELVLQREELVLTRKEIKGQKEQLEEQNKTLRHQNFENTFFQLLAHFNQIVEEITIITPHGTFNGRVNFQRWYSRIKKRYVDLKQPPSNLSEQDLIKQVNKEFYNDHESSVGHYFRTLYSIFKYVHNSRVEDKKFYTNIVRAQLSSYELFLIFYNCLSSLGEVKFKPLVERYGVLKHFDKKHMLIVSHRDAYPESAFE